MLSTSSAVTVSSSPIRRCARAFEFVGRRRGAYKVGMRMIGQTQGAKGLVVDDHQHGDAATIVKPLGNLIDAVTADAIGIENQQVKVVRRSRRIGGCRAHLDTRGVVVKLRANSWKRVVRAMNRAPFSDISASKEMSSIVLEQASAIRSSPVVLDLPLGDRRLKLMPLVALLFEEEAMDMLAEGILHKLRVLKHVERLFERTRQRRVAGLDHLAVGKLERLGRCLGRELQLALDAVRPAASVTALTEYGLAMGSGLRSSMRVDSCLPGL